MPLTKEHKKAILDYIMGEGDFSKGILEDTIVGDTYGEPGGVTWGEIHDYIQQVRKREEAHLETEENK